MNLNDIPPGETGRVTTITASGMLDRRLTGIGICRGAVIKVIRSAPLKDPIEIEVEGCYLSLRRQEATYVEMENV